MILKEIAFPVAELAKEAEMRFSHTEGGLGPS